MELNVKKGIYDVYFRGKDKGRLSILRKLVKFLNQQNISFEIELVPDKGKKYDEKEILIDNEMIPYEEMIKKEASAKALLDIVQEGQHGLTWRPIEAMFYHLKLITNFKEIVQYDFYNPKNIFILGIDDITKIGEFINSSGIKGEICCVRKRWFAYCFTRNLSRDTN